MSYDVIIIGAGHNGLAAAARLAGKGRKTLVLEARDIVGGIAAGEEFHKGYRSPGLLHDTSQLAPEVVKELKLEQHGLSFEDHKPSIFAPSSKGPGIYLHHDADKADAEIGSLSPKDAEAYHQYRAFLTKISPVVRDLLLDLPADVDTIGFSEMLRLAGKGWAMKRLGQKEMFEMLRIPVMCVADWIAEWFETDLLKAALAGPAVYGTFTGPWSPGNNLNLLLHECRMGNPVKGGAPALVEALEKAAKSSGAEIRTKAKVKRIVLENDAVKGVMLEDGETLKAKTVLSSCDPKQTFLDFIEPILLNRRMEHAMEKYRMRGTTAKVHLACEKPLKFACRPDLQPLRARTGEHLDDLERAYDAVKYGQFSENPVLDILADPTGAPQGCQTVSILVHFAPYHLKGGWNADQREKLGEAVMNVFKRYAPETAASVVGSEVLTPADLETRYGLTEGHIHHGEHSIDQLLIRPDFSCSNHKTPIEGLYLCGSGAQPGGDLTGMPGLMAAKRVEMG